MNDSKVCLSNGVHELIIRYSEFLKDSFILANFNSFAIVESNACQTPSARPPLIGFRYVAEKQAQLFEYRYVYSCKTAKYRCSYLVEIALVFLPYCTLYGSYLVVYAIRYLSVR